MRVGGIGDRGQGTGDWERGERLERQQKLKATSPWVREEGLKATTTRHHRSQPPKQG